jgi:amino acid adenylation domain-containing protein
MTYRNEGNEQRIAAGQYTNERDYWLEKLSGEPIKTTFPRDFPGKEKNEKCMERTAFRLTDPVYTNLMKISNNSDARLHIILVAGWSMLLYRYTGSSDIIVGIPTYKQEVEGQLINTALVVRNTVTGEITVKELLLQMGQTILAANRSQNYPIDTLVYKLNLPGIDPGGDFPLFDISILLEEIHDKRYLDHIRQNIIVSFGKSGSSLEGVVEYNSNLYKETTMQAIVSHFSNLLAAAVSDVNTPISRIEILSPRERKQLVEDFNDNAADFPRDKTVYQYVEDHAQKQPDAKAVSVEGETLTYEQLNCRAGQLARVLREKGVENETIAAVMMERSIDIVVSILAVWKAGGAYLPIDPSYPQDRIDYILEDSGAVILLTTSDFSNEAKCEIVRFSDAINRVPTPADLHHAPCAMRLANTLAYIIYTSGSTGQPKGAMVEHAGMMNHIHAKIDLLGITDGSVVAQNASQTFDISVWQFFAALVQGGRTVIYPDSLILDPSKFIPRLIEDGVTILEVVPSYLSVVLDVIDNKRGKNAPALVLDYLLVTGEEVKPQLVNRWFDTYPHIKVVNAYGPTEASDDITHHVMDKPLEPGIQRVPIGKPVQNFNIYIVDEHMNLCPAGVKGEICVSGVGVGRGYLKDEEKTRRVFTEDPFIEQKGVRLYKTGDLGAWLPDGTIEFFGRKDDQVKINGFRIELGEIENHLLAYPEVKEAAVIDREDEKGGKHLYAYIVGKEPAGKNIDLQGLKNHLVHVLPDYMIPAHFIPLEKLPLTPNGKIDRKALLEIEPAARTIPFISVEMLNRLQREAGGSMPGMVSKKREKDDASPDRKRTDFAAKALEEYAKLEHYSKHEENGKIYYPLSLAQKVFYFIEKTHPQTTCNNNTFTVRYPGIIEENLLSEAINTAVARYDAPRLRVVELKLENDMVPAQYVAPYQTFALDSFDFSGQDDPQLLEQQLKEINDKPFQLVESDLFYFAYVKYNREESGYIVKMHHLAVDRISFALLFREIHNIYRQLKEGKEVPGDEASTPSYIENCLLQEKGYLDSAQIKKDRAFWHNAVLPLPPEVDLSTRKGNLFNIETASSTQTVPGKLRTRMHQYCKTGGTSLFKLILSALSVYVSRVSGQENFVIGSVSHGRRTEKQKQTPGLFNRFFPINIRIDKTVTFDEFVEKNTNHIDYILKNHVDYPYELLGPELKEITGTDVRYFGSINLLYHPDWEEEYSVYNQRAGYDPNPLTIHINVDHKERYGILELRWEYQVERFVEADITGIQQGFLNVLEDALADPAKPLERIQLLSTEEKNRILYEFNDTDAAYPHHMTLHGMFEKQVEKTPEAIAVKGKDTITYNELNEKAGRLAHSLRETGVKPGTIAGIMVERSIEMLVGMMAILKAGGAYLALSLTYPDKRIGFMCRDSRMPVLLVDKNRQPRFPGEGPLLIDITENENYKENRTGLPDVSRPQDSAVVFYTSGSTGTPKGTILEHRGMVNRIHWMNRRYPIDETDVILQKTAVIFDVSVWELFWWSFYGASVYLMPPAKGGSPGDIADAVREGDVTQLHFIPTPLVSFLNYIETGGGPADNPVNALATLKRVFASGEALTPAMVDRFNRLIYNSTGTRLYNLYGPTEASIDVSYFDCPVDAAPDKIPIGKPIDNICLYILDRDLRLMPIGAAGELYISGVGLARGYLNNPELTAEKFDHDLRDLQDYHDEKQKEHKKSNKKLLRGVQGGSFLEKRPPGRRRHKLYKTGDLTRWLPDGNIEFLGRIDHQVQINGIRVEVAEIESILLKHEHIEEAVVIPRTDEKGEPFLCAFFKAAGNYNGGDFKEFLAGELPLYMHPGRFIQLEEIPLTPTGKVNRKVLEMIDPEVDQACEYVAPATEKEKLVAGIWKDVLNTDQVGIRDNFFDIGGNSLGIIQVNEKLKELFNQDIHVLALFEYPTIASIIQYLEKNLQDSPVPGQDYEEKDRREKTGRGQNKMRQRRGKLKQIRIE